MRGGGSRGGCVEERGRSGLGEGGRGGGRGGREESPQDFHKSWFGEDCVKELPISLCQLLLSLYIVRFYSYLSHDIPCYHVTVT